VENTSAKDAVIEFRDVYYYVQTGQRLLHGLNLHVRRGETLVLLGRSGSGKTTALKMLNGLLFPTSGSTLTPIQDLDGIITPNGLHFVVARSGFPDIDPAKHRLVIHGLVKQPLVFDLEALARFRK